jgi:hypothetical protein
MNDQHLAQTCCHCGRKDCPTTRAHPFPWCAPDQLVSVYGAHATAREDYLVEECAAAEEREEIARMNDVITHKRYLEALRRVREAESTTKIMRGQVQPLMDAYQAEHVEVLRLRAEIERLIGFNRAMVRLPSWEAK